ncbi:hypothetical protein F2Q69_00020498 [Brassica cretica]|uniref:Uncharacterized protein n=1 Tax=Brassica cretica TaxID=69181 RepID=A0A8S9QB49_BRACR|nr:hypothetical protein F2Q69_00020498 [Brassica cretica]
MNIVCVSALYPPSRLLHRAERCRVGGRNYEKPELKQSNFSKDEDDLILRLHALLGNRQTYERSYIQTLLLLQTRSQSLISQWCTKHNIEKPSGYTYMNGMTKYSLDKRSHIYSASSSDLEPWKLKITVATLFSLSLADENKNIVHQVQYRP